MITVNFAIECRPGFFSAKFHTVSDMRKRHAFLTEVERENERWNKSDQGETRQRNQSECEAIAQYLEKL